MRLLIGITLVRLALLVLPASPAFATEDAATNANSVVEHRGVFTCPVGGEEFYQNVEMNYFPLESLPNGSNPGGQLSDIMVPICPGNGLVLAPKYDGNDGDPEAFADYSPEELAKLPALIASKDYKALSGEANYLKLYWLSDKLGRPSMQRFHLLQHVSWIGKTAEQHRRYLEMFVAQADALIDSPDFASERRLRSRYYVVNALRELGRFDEAKARLTALQTEWDAQLSIIRAKQPPEDPNFESERDFDDNDAFSDSFFEQMAAIEARDNDTFPVSMMGDKWANAVCGNIEDSVHPVTDLTKANCAKRMAERKAYYANSQKDYKASQDLLGDPVKLAQQCKTFPEEQRDRILAEACRLADYQANRDKMEAGAAQLLKNPNALDLQCKGLVFGRYATPKTALGMACQARREAINDAETIALTKKFRSQPAEYDRLCTKASPQLTSDDPVEAACGQVKDERDDDRNDKERARLDTMNEAQIWAECEAKEAERNNWPAGVPMVVDYTPLSGRCADIRQDREEALWKALEADPVKLAEKCALPDDQQEEWYNMRCYYRQQRQEDDAALAMARDRAKLIATCDATPVQQRDRVLYKACNNYRKCVVVQIAELPFDHAAAYAYGGQRDLSELASLCFDTSGEADAAFAKYAKDPKSLRADSCKDIVPDLADPYQADLCKRYAAGENIYKDSADSALDLADEKLGNSKTLIAPPPPVRKK
ncbi:hypothetical protein [Sphingorhabdus sp.]|uniref:hypothetical protein n=1 Tax=Sphingorhabdus sp. TaxID=1902408 RepID=UPI003BAFA06C